MCSSDTCSADVYWKAQLVGRLDDIRASQPYLIGSWTQGDNLEFNSTLHRLRMFCREQEPEYLQMPPDRWIAHYACLLWRVVSRETSRTSQRILAYLNTQADFVSLNRLRQELRCSIVNAHRPWDNPVHRAASWLVDKGRIRFAEPGWTGPHFASLSCETAFPEGSFIGPLVLRYNAETYDVAAIGWTSHPESVRQAEKICGLETGYPELPTFRWSSRNAFKSEIDEVRRVTSDS